MTEETIFYSAIEKSPEERSAYLDEACADNAELRQRVEALLKSDEEAGSFLQPPEVDPDATSPPPRMAGVERSEPQQRAMSTTSFRCCGTLVASPQRWTPTTWGLEDSTPATLTPKSPKVPARGWAATKSCKKSGLAASAWSTWPSKKNRSAAGWL